VNSRALAGCSCAEAHDSPEIESKCRGQNSSRSHRHCVENPFRWPGRGPSKLGLDGGFIGRRRSSQWRRGRGTAGGVRLHQPAPPPTGPLARSPAHLLVPVRHCPCLARGRASTSRPPLCPQHHGNECQPGFALQAPSDREGGGADHRWPRDNFHEARQTQGEPMEPARGRKEKSQYACRHHRWKP